MVGTRLCAALALFLGLAGGAGPAPAQTPAVFQGKTITVVIGLGPGGTADTFVRQFFKVMERHLPGNPGFIVQHMPGASGRVATNYIAERARPDGTTILYNPWDPLSHVTAVEGVRTRFNDLDFIGGIGDVRINYARTDIVPGGMRKASDIVKAGEVVIGQSSGAGLSGTLAQLPLLVLGVKHKIVSGYRGGQDAFLALQRGEVQFHNTSVTTFRSRTRPMVEAGQAIGINYFAAVDKAGSFARNPSIPDMPAFPELYMKVHGRMPSGPEWEALNWMSAQAGELSFAALAPPATERAALAALRAAFASAMADPEFVAQSVRQNGVPYSFVSVEAGQRILAGSSDVPPVVVAVLRRIAGQN